MKAGRNRAKLVNLNLNFVKRFDARRVLDHRIRVGLVLNLEAVGQIEPFLQLATDLHDAILVVAVACPDS